MTTNDTRPDSSAATTVLVTGANKGLGLETARGLAALGWRVWLGSRDEAAGAEAAASIVSASPGADVRPLRLDVTSDESVAAAVEAVSGAGGLDVLVNNAGIGGSYDNPAGMSVAHLAPVFDVNLFGPVRVTHAFLPLLTRSSRPRLVMVSSGLGSFAVMTDPDRLESGLQDITYPPAKAALNMVTAQYAKALPALVAGFRVVAVDPGWTATALTGFTGPQSPADGAAVIVSACADDEVAGTFVDRDGAKAW